MQRGVETLDTYLKLLLQVLELRYIVSPPVCNQELWYSHQMYVYPKSSKESLFYICSVKTGINAKELNQDEPLCKSTHPKRKVRRPFCECFFFPPFPC